MKTILGKTRIPSEDLYAFNIDKQIEDYFSLLNYEIKAVDKPTRREEKKLGFDTLFKNSRELKYFALQYKRPTYITKKNVVTFNIRNSNQHDILEANWNWMFYVYPLIADYSLLEVALYHTVFAEANFAGSKEFSIKVNFPKPAYKCRDKILDICNMSYLWWDFANNFLNCKLGLIERKQIGKVKGLAIEEYPLDNYSLYVFDLLSKKVLIVKRYYSPNNNDKLLP